MSHRSVSIETIPEEILPQLSPPLEGTSYIINPYVPTTPPNEPMSSCLGDTGANAMANSMAFQAALEKHCTVPPPDSATPSAESTPSFGTSMATLGARSAAPSRDSSPSLPSRSSSPELFCSALTPFNAHRKWYCPLSYCSC
ncbi:hypothetical protein C8R44DRAFT_885315 [Mycena epipterygia]|nr:hypothetical protein C8R44DRAFT_885315 [Mycena epipterygia]